MPHTDQTQLHCLQDSRGTRTDRRREAETFANRGRDTASCDDDDVCSSIYFDDTFHGDMQYNALEEPHVSVTIFIREVK